ncbi:MAG: thiol reductant ABC exporter subunit CydD [Ilumatobacteraceae bacterium]|nr:thiol reductant ABC exporter subunit CydD [Acidimicrobiaceae bacterium]HQY84252.1 thiol reductant ABC exporter subunit CydD [Ilumatobacteraceae bacterium]
MKPVDPRLFRAARSSVSHLAITVLLGTITAVLVVVQAGLLATAVARIIERRGTSGLSPLLVALTIVVSLRATTSWAQEVAAHRASAQVKSQLRRQIVRHATRGAADPAQSARRAEVAALAGGGLDALDGYFAKYLPQLVLAVVVPAVVLLQLLRTDVTATLTVALTLPLIPVFMVLVGKATEAANARRWDALARLSHHFLDVVEGMPTLRAFGRGNAQADLVRESTDQYRSSTMATLRIAFLSSLILETLATLSVALVAVGVGLRLVDGGLDLRTGLLVILLAPEAYLPLRQVGAHYHASAAGLAAADAAFTLLEAPQPAHRGTASLPGGPLVVEMSQISVRHRDRDTPAPDHADLSLRAGEVVCLTGASGSGKTSLLTVLLGLRTADEGTVTLGSAAAAVPLTDVDLEAWQRSIGWVDQTPYLFHGTLADNLRIADPRAGDAALVDALQRAGLPIALDRQVGEHGGELSAGERRRVGLARALLRRAALVVLDEPTAGLDSATEDDVLRALRAEAARGAAVLLVSHRPAALTAADRVVRLP